MAVIKNEQKVEFNGEISLREVEATAAQLEALGPAGQKAVEVMRTLAQAVEGLENGVAYLRLVTTIVDGTPTTSFQLKSGKEPVPVTPSLDVVLKPLKDFAPSGPLDDFFSAYSLHTVGDLLSMTEKELYARGFTDSHMREIQIKILGTLGVALSEEPVPRVVPPEVAALALKSFDFSVRARKCFERANLITVGDLLGRTERQLLEIKNFGMTSLDEVRNLVLTPHNLKLKTS